MLFLSKSHNASLTRLESNVLLCFLLFYPKKCPLCPISNDSRFLNYTKYIFYSFKFILVVFFVLSNTTCNIIADVFD